VPGQPLAAGDLVSAAARLRAQFLKDFDPAYVENVIIRIFSSAQHWQSGTVAHRTDDVIGDNVGFTRRA
jgi:hypothetical protein